MTMPRCLALVLAVVATLGLAGCDSERRAISRDDLPEVPAEPDHVVTLDGDGFDLDELEVLTTDLVEFQVEGDEPRGIHTEDHGIDTGLLLPGESTFVIFDQEDRYIVSDSADSDHMLVIEARPDDAPADG